MKKILVIAAHPDDELLGVAGTVAKYNANGDYVECIILGEGQTSRWQKRELSNKNIIEELHKNTLDAARIIGFKEVRFANFPDNRFDSVDLLDIVKFIEKVINVLQPEIIYTHHGGDLNIDHKRTFQAVMTATRTVNNYSVKELYTFETLSSTEWNFEKDNSFRPNVFVDIEPFIEKKVDAMCNYKSELCDYPHPRSVEGIRILANYRAMTVGKKYVEAFELIRKID